METSDENWVPRSALLSRPGEGRLVQGLPRGLGASCQTSFSAPTSWKAIICPVCLSRRAWQAGKSPSSPRSPSLPERRRGGPMPRRQRERGLTRTPRRIRRKVEKDSLWAAPGAPRASQRRTSSTVHHSIPHAQSESDRPQRNGLIEPPLQCQRHLFGEQLSAVDGSQPPVPRLPNEVRGNVPKHPVEN